MFLAAHDAPPAAPKGLSREQAAIAFLQRYTSYVGGGDLASELVLVEDLDAAFASGAHSLRFAQRIPSTDVRVFGADTFVHFDKDGAIRFVAVGLVNDLAKLSPLPAKTADDALAIGTSDVRAKDAQAQVSTAAPAQLVIYRSDAGVGTLAWRLKLQASVLGALEAPEIFVDAQTGMVIESHDSTARGTRSGKALNVYGYSLDCANDPTKHEIQSPIDYDDAYTAAPLPTTNRLFRQGDAAHSTLDLDVFLMEDVNTHAVTTIPVTAADATAFDDIPGLQGAGAAVSSYENLVRTDANFRSFGWAGWDGTGTIPIRLAVHATSLIAKDPKNPGAGYAWKDLDAFSNDLIYLSDNVENDPTKQPTCDYRPTGVALDVVAHEFTHGIVAHTAQYGVVGESGALNEGIADVLGASVEHAFSAGDQNFVIGEDTWLKMTGRAAPGMRSMAAPRSFAASFPGELVPRAYSELLSSTDTGTNDSGHVHDNGVVIGHAFYLMTAGGKNDKTGISVTPAQAIGWDVATPLWHATLRTSHLRYGKKFYDWAYSQAEYAKNNFPAQLPDKLAGVVCAWRAVEVLSDFDVKNFNVTCDGAPTTTAPTPTTTASGACAGRNDGVICDDEALFSANICKNGGIVDTVTCSDQTLKCKRASDSDPTGSVDGDGALVCE